MKKNTLKTVITSLAILLFSSSYGQSLVEGIIKNKENQPLELANIVLKGTKHNVVTDADGKFSIDTRDKLPFVLIVQYVGYQTAEIKYTELPKNSIEIQLKSENQLSDVVITSRRRIEKAQNVPIAISVIGGRQAEIAGAFNVNRLKELVPSVQLYSSNPRNTTINIRGLGSTFGLTNDGIDPGVGFYVDGVYYARPAATTLDFVDVDQIEVLRGPQGTLFGKNTTAGAFNVTSRKPSFTSGANFELSYGNYGFLQAKSSVTGALSKKIAGRLSFSGTQRNGLIQNIATGRPVNDLNNQGVRGQLLYKPTEDVDITLAADLSKQRPDGYAQVIAGVAPTNRADYRQFNNIIASLGYSLPSTNAFDRKIDHDTPWRSGQDLGGVSLNIDTKIGNGKLTSTSAWRFWNWDPSNDRDFTGLAVLKLSQATSKHQQWSQEVRYAGTFTSKITGVFGLFGIGQDLKTDPYHIEESGDAQWRFSQDSTSPLWQTPGLFDGYGIKTKSTLNTVSGAAFGQLDWQITDKLHILPGLRYNYDKKKVDYNRTTYGGLQTNDPALIALKNKVYTSQAFKVDVDDTNFSGNLTLSYKASEQVNTFATFASSYKPVGINLGGIPTDANGPIIELAKIKPEEVNHYEIGVKTTPFNSTTVNFTIYNTDIKNYQTLVQSEDPTLNRGYLANAEKVRVRGAELDSRITVNKNLSFNTAVSYTDGKYISFTNAPLPLEETGLKVGGKSIYSKDVSGGVLPGISKWAGTLGGDLSKEGQFFGNRGRFFVAIDSYSRSSFSSSASPSKYLVVDGYSIINGRIGFRASEGLSVYIWGRNLFDKNYFEQLLPAAGNAGQYAGVLGDQRTYGITFKYTL
ncbi:TonB-dependent receptor [Flavobacterium psychrotolerans]|uniref:TonB-dependent receptor n=1 Tax=Flavobacterium psychrotolerans TaxID=2169410 RepID=A0A2U1JIY2_9FLAO|nr:TonB-dependent receptor [Flavobacterium psychrotolerans]PWA04964.1 TonB-dependent receptor [Flavobacterium psychrotolerans]